MRRFWRRDPQAFIEHARAISRHPESHEFGRMSRFARPLRSQHKRHRSSPNVRGRRPRGSTSPRARHACPRLVVYSTFCCEVLVQPTDEIRPESGQTRPIWAKLWPSCAFDTSSAYFDQHWPTLAEVQPKLVDFGQMLVNFGRYRPKLVECGQGLDKFGQIGP